MVTETDIESSPSRASSALAIVDLPAPDGDDRTSIRPRRAIRRAGVLATAAEKLIDVLNLLAELLDGRLQIEPDAGEFDVRRLGAQRVRLAVQLLAEEVELPADRPTVVEQRQRRLMMRPQPVELLARVRLGGQQRRLLRQALRRQCRRLPEQRRQLIAQPREDRRRLRRREGRARSQRSARRRRWSRSTASNRSPSARRSSDERTRAPDRGRPAGWPPAPPAPRPSASGRARRSTPRRPRRPSTPGGRSRAAGSRSAGRAPAPAPARPR